MKTFLKVAAVLIITVGSYYLLMGVSSMMSSTEIGETAAEMDETIDAGMASEAMIAIGVVLLILGTLDVLAGLLGLLGVRGNKKCLVASMALSVILLASSVAATVGVTFSWEYLIDLMLPVLLLIPSVCLLVKPPESEKSTLPRRL